VHDRQRVAALVKQLGGAYSGDLTPQVTHLVASSLVGASNTPKFVAALQLGIPVVNWSWLSDSAAAGRPLPITAAHKTDLAFRHPVVTPLSDATNSSRLLQPAPIQGLQSQATWSLCQGDGPSQADSCFSAQHIGSNQQQAAQWAWRARRSSIVPAPQNAHLHPPLYTFVLQSADSTSAAHHAVCGSHNTAGKTLQTTAAGWQGSQVSVGWQTTHDAPTASEHRSIPAGPPASVPPAWCVGSACSSGGVGMEVDMVSPAAGKRGDPAWALGGDQQAPTAAANPAIGSQPCSNSSQLLPACELVTKLLSTMHVAGSQQSWGQHEASGAHLQGSGQPALPAPLHQWGGWNSEMHMQGAQSAMQGVSLGLDQHSAPLRTPRNQVAHAAQHADLQAVQGGGAAGAAPLQTTPCLSTLSEARGISSPTTEDIDRALATPAPCTGSITPSHTHAAPVPWRLGHTHEAAPPASALAPPSGPEDMALGTPAPAAMQRDHQGGPAACLRPGGPDVTDMALGTPQPLAAAGQAHQCLNEHASAMEQGSSPGAGSEGSPPEKCVLYSGFGTSLGSVSTTAEDATPASAAAAPALASGPAPSSSVSNNEQQPPQPMTLSADRCAGGHLSGAGAAVHEAADCAGVSTQPGASAQPPCSTGPLLSSGPLAAAAGAGESQQVSIVSLGNSSLQAETQGSSNNSSRPLQFPPSVSCITLRRHRPPVPTGLTPTSVDGAATVTLNGSSPEGFAGFVQVKLEPGTEGQQMSELRTADEGPQPTHDPITVTESEQQPVGSTATHSSAAYSCPSQHLVARAGVLLQAEGAAGARTHTVLHASIKQEPAADAAHAAGPVLQQGAEAAPGAQPTHVQQLCCVVQAELQQWVAGTHSSGQATDTTSTWEEFPGSHGPGGGSSSGSITASTGGLSMGSEAPSSGIKQEQQDPQQQVHHSPMQAPHIVGTFCSSSAAMPLPQQHPGTRAAGVPVQHQSTAREDQGSRDAPGQVQQQQQDAGVSAPPLHPFFKKATSARQSSGGARDQQAVAAAAKKVASYTPLSDLQAARPHLLEAWDLGWASAPHACSAAVSQGNELMATQSGTMGVAVIKALTRPPRSSSAAEYHGVAPKSVGYADLVQLQVRGRSSNPGGHCCGHC
jgi:hypothetical protein